MNIGLIVAIVIVVLLVLWVFGTYNKFVRKREQVKEAFSTMDVYLKKRFDAIPNLVNTVKGYAKHEAETLEKVIGMRSGYSNMSVEEKANVDKEVSAALRAVNVVVEQYPDLKANTNFQQLMGEITKVEEDIASARKYYNACARKYNIAIQVIPANIIANIFKFEAYPMFEVKDEAERENVKVEF